MADVPLPNATLIKTAFGGTVLAHSEDDLVAYAAAVTAAKNARIKVLEDQLRLALTIIGHPDDDITKAMREALGDKP